MQTQTQSPPTLRTIQMSDLPDVAAIHRLAFPNSALSRLGVEAVRRYYEWQMIGPHELTAMAAYVDGQMAGFCFAGRFNGAVIGFLRRNKFYLLGQAVSHFWLFTDDLFRSRAQSGARLFANKLLRRTPPKPSVSTPQAPPMREYGILAIAVNPHIQGRGVGKLLMLENERTARKQGYEVMGLNVSCDNHQAIRFYRSLGWQEVPNEDGVWKGKMRKYFTSTEERL